MEIAAKLENCILISEFPLRIPILCPFQKLAHLKNKAHTLAKLLSPCVNWSSVSPFCLRYLWSAIPVDAHIISEFGKLRDSRNFSRNVVCTIVNAIIGKHKSERSAHNA